MSSEELYVEQKISFDRLYDWQKVIVENFKKPADEFDRTINWYWEKKGGFGKTTICKYFVDNTKCIVVNGKGNDMQYGILSYIEEKGRAPDIVVVNIPRSVEHISYNGIESIKDGLFFCGKYESKMVRFNTPHIIVFANVPPDKNKMSKDRWNIVNLAEDEDE